MKIVLHGSILIPPWVNSFEACFLNFMVEVLHVIHREGAWANEMLSGFIQ